MQNAITFMESMIPDPLEMADNTGHYKDVIEGLIRQAEIEAASVGGFTANGSKDPRKHWKEEVRAALQRAKDTAQKRLKGKTRDAIIKRIFDIAQKVDVPIN